MTTKSLSDIIFSLQHTSSSIEKKSILTKHKNHPDLKFIMGLVEDNIFNFGFRVADDIITDGSRDLEYFVPHLREYVDGNISKPDLLDAVSEMTYFDGKLAQSIVNRELRCGVSKKLMVQTWPDLKDSISFGVMLCQDSSKPNVLSHIKWPAYLEHKMDGSRGLAKVVDGVVVFYTRNGKPLKNYPIRVAELLLKAYTTYGYDTFDGEFVGRDVDGIMPRTKSNGIFNKLIHGTASIEEANSMEYHLWDIVLPKPLHQRKSLLNKLAEDLGVLVVEHTEVQSIDDALVIYQEIISRGGEGIILKNKDSLWQPKRTKDWVKFKQEIENDLICVGYEMGATNSKYQDMIGSLLFRDASQTLMVSCQPTSDEGRACSLYESEYHNKIFVIRHNGVIQKKGSNIKSLFLPRIVEMRLDKSEPDDLI